MIIPKSREISFIRIRAGMSMRQLAKRARLNIGTISNIESKSKPVSPNTAKSVSEALGASFDELFTVEMKEVK